MIHVAIVDDQQLFRESLTDLLLSNSMISAVTQFGDGAQFLSAFENADVVLPDIILLDLELPGISGIELNATIQKKYPRLKTIILSTHANGRLIASLIKAGANGYLTKNCGKDELFLALKMVSNQGHYINSETMLAIQQQSDSKVSMLHNVNNIPINLSKREVEVLCLICKEYTNENIANELFISTRTVEGHRISIIQKTGCRNSAGLVLFALRNSIFIPPFKIS